MAPAPVDCVFADIVAEIGSGRRTLLDGGSALAIDCSGAVRLDVAALSAIAKVPDARLHGAGADVRLALAVLGIDRLISPAERVSPPPAIAPAFSASIDGATVVIMVDRKASDDGRLANPQSHRWMVGLAAAVVAIDLAKLEHINSSIVAWILLLVQAGRPARFELRHVHRQVATQLTQLRLNHLLTVTD
ncbi:MAG TPA: hypothetical protein VEL07_13400 [Planctomycetota bacterium]|nr:hypothetical protein [Planctomycetota bacterium]